MLLYNSNIQYVHVLHKWQPLSFPMKQRGNIRSLILTTTFKPSKLKVMLCYSFLEIRHSADNMIS